ncbi:uncharacterized protein [Nicotiana tomentosiformis]|uniref:uncharacterized protein n=1 Tax=Nicotiana tomentosiformis TaxID=4098 RepID=UPI00051B884A|nr:uncharacterized protein LOC104101979 [Nicotiana tomentosiformis]
MANKIISKFDTDWSFHFDYTQVPNGRIWLGRKQSCVALTILESTPQVVHCHVENKSSQFQCKISFVYGYNIAGGGRGLWETLRHISTYTIEPWIILGDFNAILSTEDKVNGLPVHVNETIDFQTCVTDIVLGQVNRKGWQYSWCNKRDGDDWIYSHIDWVFGNDKWFQDYGNLEAVYYNPECSDHTPIVIRIVIPRQRLKRPIRPLNVLLKHDSFKEAVKHCWDQSFTRCHMYRLWMKLKALESEIRVLNKEMTNTENRIASLQQKMANDMFNNQLIVEEKALLIQLEKWTEIQEQILRQKSRATWISYGDANTKYFHAQLKARQSRNMISSICNDQRILLSDPEMVLAFH